MPENAPTEGPRKTGGHSALQFDPASVNSLLFSANNPATGNRWTTRMVRESGAGGSGDVWRFALPPEGKTLGDDRAGGAWIVHMLETVRTAQFSEVPFTGDLESFGLTSPRVMLRWTTNADAGEQAYELRIGNPAKDLDGTSEGFNCQVGQLPTVYVIKGALLQMLERVYTFDSLRLQTLATFSAEDVDEFEIRTDSKPTLKAHKTQDDWKALPIARHPVHADSATLGAFVEQFCHLRIERFVDDPKERAELAAGLQKQSLYELDFRGPQGRQTHLSLGAAAGHVFATESSRHPNESPAAPLAVFEIPPEILGAIAVLLR